MQDDIHDSVAELLFRIGAVHFRERPPFRFTSSVLSPVYVDCRRPISFVNERNLLIQFAVSVLSHYSFDIIAGGETAGIPYAAILAHTLEKEMVYVRKQPKRFGKNLLIEGELRPGATVILVEDLTFDAQSKIRFCAALREAGAIVDTVFSVFSYGVASSAERLRENGLKLEYLTDWKSLLKVASLSGYLTEEQITTIRSFLDDPERWSNSCATL